MKITDQKNPVPLGTGFFLDFLYGCGGSNRTNDLKVMSLASYHCSTPRYRLQGISISSVPRISSFLVPMSGIEPPTAGV